MSSEKAIIEELVRQSRTISALASVLADQAILLEKTLERCTARGNCRSAATVVHETAGVRMKRCDRCAALIITGEEKTHLVGDFSEAMWIDLPLADEIRRTAEYVQILRSLEVQPEPVQ